MHEVIIGADRLHSLVDLQPFDQSVLKKHVKYWLKENIQDKFMWDICTDPRSLPKRPATGAKFMFQNVDDAIMFKLVWA